jgi:hypothetical protein
MNKDKLILQTFENNEIISSENFKSLKDIEKHFDNKIDYFALRAIYQKCTTKPNQRLQEYNSQLYKKYHIINIEIEI